MTSCCARALSFGDACGLSILAHPYGHSLHMHLFSQQQVLLYPYFSISSAMLNSTLTQYISLFYFNINYIMNADNDPKLSTFVILYTTAWLKNKNCPSNRFARTGGSRRCSRLDIRPASILAWLGKQFLRYANAPADPFSLGNVVGPIPHRGMFLSTRRMVQFPRGKEGEKRNHSSGSFGHLEKT